MSETVKLLIVDDQVLFREALTTLLSVHDEFIVAGEAGDGKEALRMIELTSPDVVLMDLRMPVMDGVEATKKIHDLYPTVKVIILTTFDDNDDVINALKSGAVGYLMKDVTSEKLFEAVKSAYRGEYFLQPSITAKVVSELSRIPNNEHKKEDALHPDMIEPLSPREMEILHLVARGMNNKEIAGQLVITEGTVKNHLSNILGKLSARDRMQAVLKAREYGILEK